MNYTAFAGVAKAGAINVNTGTLPKPKPADFSRLYGEWIARVILGEYSIERDYTNSFFDNTGAPIQLAWTIVHNANYWDRCSVIFDGERWTCVDMQCTRYTACQYIAGVQQYLALRRAEKAQVAA